MNQELQKESERLHREAWIMFGTGLFFASFIIGGIIDLVYISLKYDNFSAGLAERSEVYVFLLFFVVGLIPLILGARQLAYIRIRRKVLKKGVAKAGKFVSSKLGYYINNEERNSITYTFVDQKGKIRTQKTACIYSRNQKIYYEKMGVFKVKVYKNKSVIIDLYSGQDKIIEQISNGCKYCNYCDSPVDIEEKNCSHCGAKEFRY